MPCERLWRESDECSTQVIDEVMQICTALCPGGNLEDADGTYYQKSSI
jgi:hypothetical protein